MAKINLLSAIIKLGTLSLSDRKKALKQLLKDEDFQDEFIDAIAPALDGLDDILKLT